MIHVACGQGSEDYQLGKKENLPVIELINDEAYYLEGMDEFSCQSAKKHPEIIIDYLKAKDSLLIPKNILTGILPAGDAKLNLSGK